MESTSYLFILEQIDGQLIDDFELKFLYLQFAHFLSE